MSDRRMYAEDEEEAPRKKRKPKPPQCEFCGTTDPNHNIRRKMDRNERHHMLCDNPVCNAIPGGVV